MSCYYINTRDINVLKTKEWIKIKNKVRFYRNKAKITQKQLAESTYISERQIQRIEKEEDVPNGENLLILAKFFKVPVEKIFFL